MIKCSYNLKWFCFWISLWGVFNCLLQKSINKLKTNLNCAWCARSQHLHLNNKKKGARDMCMIGTFWDVAKHKFLSILQPKMRASPRTFFWSYKYVRALFRAEGAYIRTFDSIMFTHNRKCAQCRALFYGGISICAQRARIYVLLIE